MANAADTPMVYEPIGGCFVVDPSRPLRGAGAGLPAFGASDTRSGRTDLMAVAVARDSPARARVLQDLTQPIDNLLIPLGHGNGPAPDGTPSYYVISPAPPGPSLAEPEASGGFKPWPEAALIAFVLRPIAQVLRLLQTQGVTHRAIRADNVFSRGRGVAVVLGAAWAAPPAMHQPAIYEPYYSQMCHPAGRGDGVIADDVYALGVLLIVLAAGTPLLRGTSDADILRRKLELGGFNALAEDLRLPPIIGDLARGMLAEEPDHRPTPAMLLDPNTARGRRVAARPPRRAQRPLEIGGASASDALTLAHSLCIEPKAGVHALRNGLATQWLRRGLGDAALCVRVDDLIRHRAIDREMDESRADALLAMRVIATIDPLAPLCWRGIALWPDGVGPALAAARREAAIGGDRDFLAYLEEIVLNEVIIAWALMREERCDLPALRLEAHTNRALLQIRAPAGGVPRLTYALNPLLPCGGALAAGRFVSSLADVAPAMNAIAQGSGNPFDAEVVAFIATRSSRRLDMEVSAIAAASPASFPAMPWLRLMTQLQAQYFPHPLPALAARITGDASILDDRWHNRDRRAEVAARLRTLSEAGLFAAIIVLLDDPPGHAADREGALMAATAVARIDAELRQIAHGAQSRAVRSVRLGQEIAAGIGLTALAVVLALAALG